MSSKSTERVSFGVALLLSVAAVGYSWTRSGSARFDARGAAAGPSAIREHFQARFREQPVEAEWRRSEERTLGEYFAGVELEGLELESLECRSTLCRINLKAVNLAQLEAFVEGLGAPPFSHGAFYQANAEESTLMLFAAREGYQLPPVPAGM